MEQHEGGDQHHRGLQDECHQRLFSLVTRSISALSSCSSSFVQSPSRSSAVIIRRRDPSKNTRRLCCSAARVIVWGAVVAEYMYRGPSCTCFTQPRCSSRASSALTAE